MEREAFFSHPFPPTVQFVRVLTFRIVRTLSPFRPPAQDLPFSERHPSLGRPVYVRLLDVLLSKCELPEGFVSWDDQDADEADEEAFSELREGAQVLASHHRPAVSYSYIRGIPGVCS